MLENAPVEQTFKFQIVEVCLERQYEAGEEHLGALTRIARSVIMVREIPPVEIDNNDQGQATQANTLVERIRYLLLDSPAVHERQDMTLMITSTAAQVACAWTFTSIRMEDGLKHDSGQCMRYLVDMRCTAFIASKSTVWTSTTNASMQFHIFSLRPIRCARCCWNKIKVLSINVLSGPQTPSSTCLTKKPTDSRDLQPPSSSPVRVISTPQRKSWTVLLPGWGKAWVYWGDCTDENVLPPCEIDSSPSRHSIQELGNLSMSSVTSCRALLRVIGSKLKVLEVGHFLHNGSLDILEALFQGTRVEVEELRVGWLVLSLDEVVRSLTQFDVRIKRLSIMRVETEDTQHLQSFFNPLADVTQPLAMHLEEVYVAVMCPEAVVTQAVHALNDALQVNRKLCSVCLQFPGYCYNVIVESLRPSIETAPFIRIWAMDLAQKLSLLDVVRLSPDSPLGRLDTAISRQFSSLQLKDAHVLATF